VGGNISDYVACEQVRDTVKDERDVAVAKTAMFACSDATQQEIVEDIREEELDGLVIASCSPTLHRFTFREVCKRAGLNPYQYVHVNLREQCSWAHTDNAEQATDKAILMVRAGIAKARYTEALQEIRIKTVQKVLVIGAGIAGLRAALALSDLGLPVVIAEREAVAGGWVDKFGRMYPRDRRGSEMISSLVDQVRDRANITLYTDAELMEKSGCVGDFDIKLRVGNEREVSLNVGAIVICTGFESYKPGDGEFGYGSDGVLTLPEFKELLDDCNGRLEYKGTQVKAIAYIYCVGNLRRRGSVFPISSAATTKWARGLGIPQGGKTVIYTGHMYQLVPYISASVAERLCVTMLLLGLHLTLFDNPGDLGALLRREHVHL
jgi:heterodisulfide reductase subunit A